MYYVSHKSKDGKKFGITDTKDGVVEWYTASQILELTKRNIWIKGVSVSQSGLVISILEPSDFIVLDRAFFSENTNIYSKAEAEAKRTKNTFLGGSDFYKMFDCLSETYCITRSNIKNLYLELAKIDTSDSGKGYRLFFRFLCDYSNSTHLIPHNELEVVLNSSPYRDRLHFVSKKINYRFDDSIFYMDIPINIMHYIKSNMRDLYNREDIQLLMENKTKLHYQDLYLTSKRRNTNIGKRNVISIFFNYDGLLIPLIMDARIQYIQNMEASDSEVFFKYIEHLK